MSDERNERGEGSDDSVRASLYATLCQFGFTEATLIWARSAAFLIVHGFLIHLIGGNLFDTEYKFVLMVIALFGIFLSTLWHITNYWGWRNQNRWYRIASKVKITGMNIKLPTDDYADRDVRPAGQTYQISQLLSWSFGSAYASALLFVCVKNDGCLGGWGCVGIVAAIVVFVPLVTFRVEKSLHKRWLPNEDT